MFFKKFNHKKLIIFLIFLFLNNCQIRESSNTHGIVFLDNRSNKLIINETNKNDVLKIVGQPHSKSFNNENEWIYIERVLVKGEYHKLGQNIVKENNVMVLSFDKYGILKEKNLFDKNKLAKIKFSKKITENNLSQRSFVQEFLQSIKAKMYGNR